MKKVKNLAPKTLKWRKAIKIILWICVIFWTLGSLRGFSSSAKLNDLPRAEAKKQETKTENLAVSVGAQTFAQNFLKEYFTWNKNNYQERIERLKPYMRTGMDEQAGLRYDSLTGNSSLDKSELWQVSETDKDTSIITFKVSHSVKATTETKVKGKIIKKEVKTGPFEKWVQVPVITDGKTYLINGIPTFTSKPAAANIQPIKTKAPSNEADAQITAEIKDFLNTFYKQYSTGTQAELQFLTSDPSLQPLDKTIVFKEIENLVITNKKKDIYSLEVDVLFTDSGSKAQILQKNRLEVSKQNGRYQVSKFN